MEISIAEIPRGTTVIPGHVILQRCIHLLNFKNEFEFRNSEPQICNLYCPSREKENFKKHKTGDQGLSLHI